MRTIHASLQAKLTSGTTNLCHIVTITRKDGTIFRYTDLDLDLTVDGDLYESSNSFAVSAITSSANNGIQSTNCNIFFDAAGFTEAAVAQGAYDSALVEFSVVDYTNTAWGKMILLTGRMTSVTVTNRKVGSFEMSGLLSVGDAKIGESYSSECRANLGDARCKVPLISVTNTGEITNLDAINAIQERYVFRIEFDGTDPTNRQYDNGVLTFTSGNNVGVSTEIQAQFHADALYYGPFTHDIFLSMPLPNDVQIGDTFDVALGCDKRPITCLTKFDNIVNFRGEPFVPGSNYIMDLKLI